MLRSLCAWRREILIADDLRIRILGVECHLGGCRACDSTYYGLVLSGVGHNRQRHLKRGSPFYCLITQYEVHCCETRNFISDTFFFKFDFENPNFCAYHLVPGFRQIVRQYVAAKTSFWKLLDVLPNVLRSLVAEFLIAQTINTDQW